MGAGHLGSGLYIRAMTSNAPATPFSPNGLVSRAPEIWLGLVFSSAMLGGAYAFQYLAGLAPCQMCHWQRWAHWCVVAFGLAGLFLPNRRLWGVMVASGLLASVIIAATHAGVEYGWWEGPKGCAAGSFEGLPAGGDLFGSLADDKVVDCAEPAWVFLGVSMAGWNALLSLGALLLVGLGIRRAP